MLDPSRIRAITLDLDDTLWPVWPTIRRANQAMRDWLAPHAPQAAALAGNAEIVTSAREAVASTQPDIAHDLGATRREVIRHLLRQAGEDTALAEPAFEVFHDARQRVSLFDDALPALEFLAARYPLVALSNGNADIQRVGLGHLFQAAISATSAGVAKPDPRIFRAGADAARVPADRVLHIGDDAHLDVAGALAIGMQAAWVNRTDMPWPAAAPQPQATVRYLMQLCRLLEGHSTGA